MWLVSSRIGSLSLRVFFGGRACVHACGVLCMYVYRMPVLWLLQTVRRYSKEWSDDATTAVH